ncbi:ERCC4 domain containing protein [Rhodotorula toruloides]|uniref:BY PROTMAP: gi/472588511/gb/EMS25983.1/ ERCC4 domain containing protein [Rhodosporidium toruloides NP11] gi/647396303/emb/CDR38351.1/ RHTO0S03e08548g1_1 [Rhodosporidium toruloides] n=1 Tax=Rhodotorula toruloides TaxID=5286 RepID=A0A0K3C4S7_RHOTO|nr:ERCC4 domain containing protein [Rhodotorula toruloides]PRQ77881.1 hypothetical protein AAT19DRAFT_8949 [Rhodotorula toruloides]
MAPTVIELSESSDDDSGFAEFARGGAGRGGSTSVAAARPAGRAYDLATSDDLPPPTALFGAISRANGRTDGGQAMGRSASMTAGTSKSAQSFPLQRAHTLAQMSDLDPILSSSPHAMRNNFGLLSSPALPPPARPAQDVIDIDDFDADEQLRLWNELSQSAKGSAAPKVTDKGKGKAQVLVQEEEDLWADILASPATDPKGEGKKGKGKGKEKERSPEEGPARKRSLSAAVGEEDVPATARKGKTSRLSAEVAAPARATSAASTSTTASTAGLSKTALKKLETADRMRLREANTLRAGDKKVTTAELTVHISGTAFASPDADSSDEDSDDLYGDGGHKKKGKTARKKSKPSPWLEVTRDVQERLKQYDCDVESPEAPRQDLGCEGAVRWTRLCDRMWSEERRMYVPLKDKERIVVEEDSRLIFLTALDLSRHIANSTLSSHISTIQSRLPPHVNLFVMLYGLNTLYRDMERARQEAYRNSIRAGQADGADATAKGIKPAGIGESQPSRDELELEMMRVQVKSRCMIVSVDKVAEAVDWFEQLTFDIGQKPYQRLKHSHISILGTSEDKVVSGKDLQDTYIRMLASLPKVTESVAKGIVAEYPTLRALYESWDRCPSERDKKEMLVGIGKGRNLDGTATNRAIGKDLSAFIYKVFNSRDPTMFL